MSGQERVAFDVAYDASRLAIEVGDQIGVYVGWCPSPGVRSGV